MRIHEATTSSGKVRAFEWPFVYSFSLLLHLLLPLFLDLLVVFWECVTGYPEVAQKADRVDGHERLDVPLAGVDPTNDKRNEETNAAQTERQNRGDTQTRGALLEHLHDDDNEANECGDADYVTKHFDHGSVSAGVGATHARRSRLR